MKSAPPLWNGGLADRRKQASGDPGRGCDERLARNGQAHNSGSPFGLCPLTLATIAAAGLQ